MSTTAAAIPRTGARRQLYVGLALFLTQATLAATGRVASHIKLVRAPARQSHLWLDMSRRLVTWVT